MLDLLGMADAILRDAAHETHLMCERSVARPPPDLSDLSDSDDESSDGDESATSAASASPEFPDPCDHVPDSSGAQANNSSSAWAVHADSDVLTTFLTDAPWDILLRSRECMPHLRCVLFSSLHVAGHTQNVQVSAPRSRATPPQTHVSLHATALRCAGRQDSHKKGSNDSASKPSRDSPRARRFCALPR